MKILITGTAGFTLWNKITNFNAKHYSTGRIGFHLAKRLLERGDRGGHRQYSPCEINTIGRILLYIHGS